MIAHDQRGLDGAHVAGVQIAVGVVEGRAQAGHGVIQHDLRPRLPERGFLLVRAVLAPQVLDRVAQLAVVGGVQLVQLQHAVHGLLLFGRKRLASGHSRHLLQGQGIFLGFGHGRNIQQRQNGGMQNDERRRRADQTAQRCAPAFVRAALLAKRPPEQQRERQNRQIHARVAQKHAAHGGNAHAEQTDRANVL